MNIFSTFDVHPKEKLKYWIDLTSTLFPQLSCIPVMPSDFNARLSLTNIAKTRLITIDTDACLVSRDRSSRHHDNDLLLGIQLAGTACLNQNGSALGLNPGDAYLYCACEPHTIAVAQTCSQLVVKIERNEIESRLGRVERFAPQLLRGDRPACSTMAEFWRMLPLRAEALSDHVASMISTQAFDLLAVALEEAIGREQKSLRTNHMLTLKRIKIFIESHLSEPDLSCDAIAAAAGFSRRHISRLFELDGTSLERYIQLRRLERCREALSSQQQSSRSIAEIAFAWGFKDAAHFSRSFKQLFDETPRNFRALKSAPANTSVVSMEPVDKLSCGSIGGVEHRFVRWPMKMSERNLLGSRIESEVTFRSPKLPPKAQP
ncbi:Transcriptional activator NphR [Methylovirgula sp. HY1]|nr:Transcriptional activator NphR [Methylovirgula sp. HY1]